MEKRYLGHVRRGEQAAVRLLGARWDAGQGRWYISERADPTPFRYWLDGGASSGDGASSSDGDFEAEFSIVSDEAAVIAARSTCWHCRQGLHLICLYCRSGLVLGEAAQHFTVSNITALDDDLRSQLARWPYFRPVRRALGDSVHFANHCSSCEKSQDDFYLHCHPQGVFFNLESPAAAQLEIHPLQGLVRLSGDEGYGP